MDFLISDTFFTSLCKLTAQEQKAAKTTAFDLQMNPANPGMQFHKLDRAKDRNFWSVRVNCDIRAIVHRTANSLLLCYVGHHDDAYNWAERRRLQTHPKTGAAQLVEVRETIREIIVPRYVEDTVEKPLLFKNIPEEDLLKYGVPPEWIEDVTQSNEDTILGVADHLPCEAAEALLNLATGTEPIIPEPSPEDDNPFGHPDAKRRFRVMHNVEELERALEFPWDKWSVFLHPAQKELVERNYNGPFRVSGSAGTGKTVVALHRAVHLARSNPEARVLLTTFSDPLANALQIKLRRLIYNEPRIAERLEVYSMDSIGKRLYQLQFGSLKLATIKDVKKLIERAIEEFSDLKFSQNFLTTEWVQIVDARQIDNWDSYCDVVRLGRKTRLPESRRAVLWKIFSWMQTELKSQNKITTAKMFYQLAVKYQSDQHPPFDFVVIDEAQDISIPQLKFLASLGSGRSNSLFFTGDLGQRIFQQPFSWKSLGVNIWGRSKILKINYRTSHQIRHNADKLLDPQMADVDGIVEDRRGTISVFNGPKPVVYKAVNVDDEIKYVSEWLSGLIHEGLELSEIGVFVRSVEEIGRAEKTLRITGTNYVVLDDKIKTKPGHISLCTMHLAKGLEFKAVLVIACDEDIIPLKKRITIAEDESDIEEIINTERHLLYVACTRAREHLLISGIKPLSIFIDDMGI